MEPLANFNFEILNGCNWDCPGCQVDKEEIKGFPLASRDSLLKVLDDFSPHGVILDEAIFGPTDFASARNFAEVIDDPFTAEILRRFRESNWPTTLMSRQLEERTTLLDNFLGGGRISLTIIVDAQRIHNEHYTNLVKSNFDRFKSRLKRVQLRRVFTTVTVNPFRPGDRVNFMNDLEATALWLRETFGVYIDHGHSYARTTSLSRDKEKILPNLHWIKNIYESAFNPEKLSNIPFDYNNTNDWHNLHYMYKMGRFYWAPVLFDAFYTFDEKFEIKLKDYSFDELWEHRNQATIAQFQEAQELECSECEFLGRCVLHGLPAIMAAMKHSSCIAPKESFKALLGREGHARWRTD